MKLKTLLLLAFVALISFTGCAGDEVTANQDEKQGMTAFVVEENASPVTRTTAEYDGSGINFFWTPYDFIWVNNSAASPALQMNARNDIPSTGKAAKAKFWFNGNFTASSYPLRYTTGTGKGDEVRISSYQIQKEPNDASHFGSSGDCGTATAHNANGVYKFTLDHKASYITFLPYSTDGSIKETIIQKIKVEANKAIAGTYSFDDNGLDTTSPTGSSNDITLRLKINYNDGFPVPSSPSATTNAALMVIAPGTYSSLKVTYTIYDPETTVSGDIVKEYSNVTFTAGKNKKISTDLKVPIMGDDFYMWDAQQEAWDGFKMYQSFKVNAPDSHYPSSKTSDPLRWYNDAAGNPVAANTAKDCPNFNETLWYILKGDPHLVSGLCSMRGHLFYMDGVWFKKKANIPGFRSDEGPAPYNYDYRLSSNYLGGTMEHPATLGEPSNKADYFFVAAPRWGYSYSDGGIASSLGGFGTNDGKPTTWGTVFWTSTGTSNFGSSAYGIMLNPSVPTVRTQAWGRGNAVSIWKGE
nr:hypothetical protein [uncultured Prevotella sp.]